MQKTVAILGTGAVGQALAAGFIKHGYWVAFGTHHPEKEVEWADPVLSGSRLLGYAEAAAASELAVLAVKGSAAEAVVKRVMRELAGKTLIDATNPIADVPPANGVLNFFTALDDSLLEKLQRLAPAVHFVKAFNSVGHALMVNPDFGGQRPTMFICGDSTTAKAEVAAILDQFGWEVADMGGPEGARAIEPLCMLWCIPGFMRNEWRHAFKLLQG